MLVLILSTYFLYSKEFIDVHFTAVHASAVNNIPVTIQRSIQMKIFLFISFLRKLYAKDMETNLSV